jgi:hypothetical protein
MILELGLSKYIAQQHIKTANEQLNLIQSVYEKLWIHSESRINRFYDSKVWKLTLFLYLLTCGVYLSHAQLSEYLSYLGERGLIEALPKQIKVSSSVEKQYIQNNRKRVSLAADFSRNWGFSRPKLIPLARHKNESE